MRVTIPNDTKKATVEAISTFLHECEWNDPNFSGVSIELRKGDDFEVDCDNSIKCAFLYSNVSAILSES